MATITTPLAFWNLNESSGNATDAVNGNVLVNNNSATYGAGLIGNAVDFGAANTNKYLGIASALGLSGTADKSISCWVKLDAEIASGNWFLFELTTGGGRYVDVSYDYNSGAQRVTLDIGNGGTKPRISGAFGTSNWHFIVATQTGTSGCNLYVDNVAAGSQTPGSNTDVSSHFNIGSTGGGGFSSVQMDMVGVWDVVLSTTEITALYNGGAGLQYPFTSTNASFLLNFV